MPKPLALARALVGNAEVADEESERPAILLRELPERRHRSAFDAEGDGVVEAVDAALRHTGEVVEV
ncbi:hypothetical protein D3C83_293460 [compost metagenome]